MDDHKGIELCISKYAKPDSYYVTNPDEKRQEPAATVMRQLQLVGTKITDVSTIISKKANLIVKSTTRFYLIVRETLLQYL